MPDHLHPELDDGLLPHGHFPAPEPRPGGAPHGVSYPGLSGRGRNRVRLLQPGILKYVSGKVLVTNRTIFLVSASTV